MESGDLHFWDMASKEWINTLQVHIEIFQLWLYKYTECIYYYNFNQIQGCNDLQWQQQDEYETTHIRCLQNQSQNTKFAMVTSAQTAT